MTQSKVKNLAASVKARLANLARKQKEDFQELLSRYGRERLLYRLSVSEYRERFILKGALMFAYWTGAPHRPTRDMDLLGHGDPDIATLEKVFRDLCTVEVQPDGLVFEPDSVKGERIKTISVRPSVPRTGMLSAPAHRRAAKSSMMASEPGWECAHARTEDWPCPNPHAWI